MSDPTTPAGDRQLDAVVVGGGIAGLAAAWQLRDLDVIVLEQSGEVGGRIRSERRGDYWLNFGAHVFGSPDSASGRLLASLGVTTAPAPGRLAAVSLNGKTVASGPVESFPFRLPLSPGGRLSLVRAGIRLRLAVRKYASIAAPRAGEAPADRQRRMLEYLDDRSFSEFIGPLPEDVDLLFRATLTRSSGEPEDLAAGYGIGYFHLVWNRDQGLSRNVLGGSSSVIEALADALPGRILTDSSVEAVVRDGDGVRVEYAVGGEPRRLRARAAVVATPAYATRAIVAGLPVDTAAALEAIPYGPYVVGGILTGETAPRPWDDLYALATPRRSFNMLFNTANVLRVPTGPRAPGGSLMVYAAADLARRLDDLSDAAVAQRFADDLLDLYPQLRGDVSEVVIRRWERGLPYPRPGRSRLQPALVRDLAPVYLAGDYLGTWYTETAVQTATDAAAAVRRQLGAAAAPPPGSG